MLLSSTSEMDANQRLLMASKMMRGSVSRSLPLPKNAPRSCVCTSTAAPPLVRQVRSARFTISMT